MSMIGLTTDQEKILTEFLGECWHEYGSLTGYEHHSCRCSKCNNPIMLIPFVGTPKRLDFSDWRIIGRLIVKANETCSENVYTPEYLMWLDIRDALHAENIPLAICLAICRYLEER